MQVWVNGKKINECQFLKKLGFNVVSCTLGVVIDAVANLCDEVAHGVIDHHHLQTSIDC